MAVICLNLLIINTNPLLPHTYLLSNGLLPVTAGCLLLLGTSFVCSCSSVPHPVCLLPCPELTCPDLTWTCPVLTCRMPSRFAALGCDSTYRAYSYTWTPPSTIPNPIQALRSRHSIHPCAASRLSCHHFRATVQQPATINQLIVVVFFCLAAYVRERMIYLLFHSLHPLKQVARHIANRLERARHSFLTPE
jgi:hypothetical protein